MLMLRRLMILQKPFQHKLNLAIVSPAMHVLMLQERSLRNCNLSHLLFVEDDFINMIDQMCPTIKSLNLQGNLDLWINQSISVVITPFRFLISLNLSKCAAVWNWTSCSYQLMNLSSLFQSSETNSCILQLQTLHS